MAKIPKEAAARPSIHSGMTWEKYLEALHAADEYWTAKTQGETLRFSVFDGSYSWTRTISECGALAKATSWLDLNRAERDMLLGLNDTEGAWGLLGSMNVAGQAVAIFRAGTDANKLILQDMRQALTAVLQAVTANDIIIASKEALRRMCAVNGIGMGVSTRLLTLARPDVCVSVNGGSRPGLAGIEGLQMNEVELNSPNKYGRLLSWIFDQPWHNEPNHTKDDPKVHQIWSMRAALVDCFVYNPPAPS